MDNPLDFLDGASPAEQTSAPSQPAEAAAPEPTTQATPEPTQAIDGPVRGPDGKFASKAADPASVAPQAPVTTPEAVQPAPEPAKAPDGYVPVSALQAEREKTNAYRRQLEEQSRQPAPDLYEDPDGFVAYQQEQLAATNFRWSRDLLAARHGEDTATQVQQWAEQRAEADPVFYQRALSTQDPFGFAMDEWKRDQVLTRLSDPAMLDRFLAFASGQTPTPQAAAPAFTPAAFPQPAAPPPSITQAPSAGGVQHVPLGQAEVFSAAFG